MFPVIKHIDDVLPHIADKPEIARIEKDGYTVLDYIYAGVSTFDNEFARECRGLKFDHEGKLIARPFHKFFNLNETEETKFENQDWNLPVVITNKWDGSMIHPALVKGELVFMTRKGVTDVALQAMRECEYDADEMVRLIKEGYTPIYEFVSPNNKIVLHYDEAKLVPINLRKRTTGKYDHTFCRNAMRLTQNETYARDLFAAVKKNTGIEGLVIQFHTPEFSRFIKLKADEYCDLHRVLDETAHEKRVLGLIMDSKLDDVIPLINPDRAEHLKKYAAKIESRLLFTSKHVVDFCETNKNLSQKDFALKVQAGCAKEHQGFMFKARELESCDVASVVAIFKAFFKKTLTTQLKVDHWRKFLGDPVFQMPVD